MKQRFHLDVRARATGRVLAFSGDCGWALPSRLVPARIKAAPELIEYLRTFGVQGFILMITPWRFDPHARELSWVCRVDADAAETLTDTILSWQDANALSCAPALLPEQVSVLGTSLPVGLASLDMLRTWIDARLATNHIQSTGWPLQYRASVQRTVIKFDTTEEPVFFKSTIERPFREALATRALSEMCPCNFPRTLAFDELRGWWLASPVPGRSLRDDSEYERARSAIEAVASIQVMTRDCTRVLERAGAWRASIGDRVEQTIEWLPGESGFVTPQECERIAHEARQACEMVRALDVPDAWIHGDLAGDNIFVDHDRVSFIDLNRSWIGPAPIAAIDFIREQQIHASHLRDAYLSRWPVADRRRMCDGWLALETLADVARAHEFLTGLPAYAICEHGEILVELLTARIARRLLLDLRSHAAPDVGQHQ